MFNIFKSKIVKAGIWYTIGNFLVKGIAFLTLPIFTRLLTPEDFGILSLFNVWVAIFSVVFPLDLHASVIRAKYDFEGNFHSFLKSVYFLGIFSASLFGVLLILFGNRFLGFSRTLLLLMYIIILGNFSMNFIKAKWTSEYAYKNHIIISLFYTITSTVLSILLILKIPSDKFLGRIYGNSITAFAIFLFVLSVIFTYKGELTNKTFWKYALKYSLPLIPHNLSGLILAQFDRIVINSYDGTAKTGIYSFAYTVGMTINVIWGSLNSAWVPWFYENMNKKEYEKIIKNIKRYILLFTSITLLAIFLSPEIVKVAGSEKFREGIDLVPIIMSSYYFVFLYSIPGNYEFYLRKTHYISIGTMLAGAINILLNFIFVPKYGYVSAAWTTLISYIFLFFFHYTIAAKLGGKIILRFTHFLIGMGLLVAGDAVFYVTKDIIAIRIILALTLVLLSVKYVLKKRKV